MAALGGITPGAGGHVMGGSALFAPASNGAGLLIVIVVVAAASVAGATTAAAAGGSGAVVAALPSAPAASAAPAAGVPNLVGVCAGDDCPATGVAPPKSPETE